MFIFLIIFNIANAENHDAEQNIIDKAKEINQQVKQKQANQSLNISTEITNKEEELPLNDPFVGDESLTGNASTVAVPESEEEKRKISLYKYKLVGVVASDSGSFASLIDPNGEILTLSLFEELSPGIKLVALNTKEAVFEKDEMYLAINFKNQIIERAK